MTSSGRALGRRKNMKNPVAFQFLGSAAIALGGPALAAPMPQGSCEIVRIMPDGREVRSRGEALSVTHRSGTSSHASAASASSGRGSSRSSVSVSSSSSSNGKGHARAVTSYTDERGRQVTTVRDERGCRITIDERDQPDTGEE